MAKKKKHTRTPAEKAARTRRENKKRQEQAKAPDEPKITPYPRAGRKVTEFEEALDKKIAGEPDSVVAAPPTAEPPDLDVRVIAQVCQIPFDLWSLSQDVDGLKLTDTEARMMAKPARQLLDHYLPQIPVIAWAWVSLTATSYGILKSRLVLIQELKKQKASSGEGAAEATGNPRRPVEQGSSPPSSPAAITFPTLAKIKDGVKSETHEG